MSSDSESSDEEKVPSKENMKELPPPPPPKKNHSLVDLHPTQGINIQNLNLSLVLRNEGMFDEADLGLQVEMIDADVTCGRGAVYPHLPPQTGGED